MASPAVRSPAADDRPDHDHALRRPLWSFETMHASSTKGNQATVSAHPSPGAVDPPDPDTSVQRLAGAQVRRHQRVVPRALADHRLDPAQPARPGGPPVRRLLGPVPGLEPARGAAGGRRRGRGRGLRHREPAGGPRGARRGHGRRRRGAPGRDPGGAAPGARGDPPDPRGDAATARPGDVGRRDAVDQAGRRVAREPGNRDLLAGRPRAARGGARAPGAARAPVPLGHLPPRSGPGASRAG